MYLFHEIMIMFILSLFISFPKKLAFKIFVDILNIMFNFQKINQYFFVFLIFIIYIIIQQKFKLKNQEII